MKVAILLASYNGSLYIKKQIDSIIAQSYKDWFLYISDDCSSDDTLKILDEYEKCYPGKIIVVSKNIKYGSAKKNFLHLFSIINSDLYFFCDQDDVWTEDHISKMIDYYSMLDCTTKENPVLIHSDLYIVNSNLEIINESFFNYSFMPKHINKKNYYLLENNITGGVMVVNDSLKQIIFSHVNDISNLINLIPMHDQFFGLISSLFGNVFFIDEKLEFYRQHQNNAIGAKKTLSFNNVISKIFQINDSWIKTMENQSQLLFENFGDLLSAEDKLCYKEMSKFSENKKVRQLYLICKYRLYKVNKLRKCLQIKTILLRKEK